jgi:hypothetical protein
MLASQLLATDVSAGAPAGCLAMPHLAHMAFAAVVVIVFMTITLMMSISDCDLNPLSKTLLASPQPIVSFKVLLCKMVCVLVSAILDGLPDVQIIVILLCVALATYYLVLAVSRRALLAGWSARRAAAAYSTTQHNAAQHSTAQHSTAQRSTAQHSAAQRSTAQHSTTQHSTAQHSTAQHSTECQHGCKCDACMVPLARTTGLRLVPMWHGVQVPYYYDMLNHIWIGLFFTLLYTSTLLVVFFYVDRNNAVFVSDMTWVRCVGTHAGVGVPANQQTDASM